ncbi:MAG: hypothetical protein BWY85_02377 [Firmicutes bacterium ADurb.Bin506]|nr:MAG: hypothetical protein BWY85_02377 [Firmicutes bacterium ADurb.Bin506]
MLKTAIGDIVLKRITALEAEEATISAINADPDFAGMVERAHDLATIGSGNGMSAEQLLEYESIGKRLEPHAMRMGLYCFVDPKISTVEEFDALLSALGEEAGGLRALIGQLSSTKLDGEVVSSALAISKEYGIPLTNDLTIENMTAHQSAVLSGELEKQNSQLRSMFKHG